MAQGSVFAQRSLTIENVRQHNKIYNSNNSDCKRTTSGSVPPHAVEFMFLKVSAPCQLLLLLLLSQTTMTWSFECETPGCGSTHVCFGRKRF